MLSQSVLVFPMILTVNSYYLTKQQQPVGLCNEYECTYVRCEGANRNFK
jgi:hypothetical protein